MTRFDTMILMLLGMLLMHCIEDFHVQGILANLKRYEWWLDEFMKQGRDLPPKYAKDYLVALVAHSFEWTMFVLAVPIALGMHRHMDQVLLFAVVNTAIHAFVDNLKANEHLISLVADQAIHLAQIVGIWIGCAIAIHCF